MHDYSIADIERLIGLSRSVVRSLIRQRFVAPHRGRRREYRFSFQDLIVLRTAKALSTAQLSNRRITRSLRDLRRRLPEHAPISGLSLRAVGDSVSIREGQSEWDSHSGQYLLALDVVISNGTLHIIERAPAPPALELNPPPLQLHQLFDQAARLENSDPQQAITLYQRCLELEVGNVEARINCARLLHQAGQFELAERLYRVEACLRDADAMFNLGVLLEDTGRSSEAIDSYLAAIALDPGLADAHYNLARLYEIAGNGPHMIRHLRQYRTLVSAAPAP
ncbi:MAG: tetratricopeptide repeat protein [Steroidobacterales bacterium]